MKKLLSLVTALICALTLMTTAFAAEADLDAYSIYNRYVEKSKSISSMRLSLVQKISATDGSESIEITKQNAEVKMIIAPDNNLQMEMMLSDSASNETAYVYFKDNYLYQKAGNQKFKIAMNMDEAMASATGLDVNIPEDALKDAKIEKVEGGTKITYVTKVSDLNDVSGGSVASLINDLDLPDDIKMNLSDITSSLIIGDDGMLKSFTNVFSVTVSEGDESVDLKISQHARVNLVNAFAQIDFPLDLAAYKTLQ